MYVIDTAIKIAFDRCMINRKRYYNSFFDQINEYKSNKHDSHSEPHDIHHHTLGVGLFASVMVVALFGGLNSLSLPSFFGREQVVFVKSESRPAFSFSNSLRQADDSFASELSGNTVIPVQDAYSDATNRRSNYGGESVLFAGGAQQARAFLKYSTKSLKSREDLVLKLYPSAAFSGTITVYALPTDVLWEEDTLTGESAPNSNGRQLARSSGTFNPDVSVDFDLKDFMAEDEVSLVVVAAGGRSGFGFYSREGSLPPQLTTVR